MLHRTKLYLKLSVFLLLCCFLTSCVIIPKNILKPDPKSLEMRQQQSRQFETTDESKIIFACSGVLQDMGFTISESEKKLGVLSAKKDRDAKNATQLTIATLAMVASFGNTSSYLMCDSTQNIRACITVKPISDTKRSIVRVTFQRVVFNIQGRILRFETLKDKELYDGFFEKLSKSVFLEAQAI